MDVIYGLIPSMIIIGIVLVGLIIWSSKSGQFDDLDGEAYRILMDEDLDDKPEKKSKSSNEAAKVPHGED